MTRLIDADALKEELAKRIPHFAQRIAFALCFDAIRNAPTVDAVEVVRCGECKYFVQKQDNIGECSALLSGKFTGRYWFCADGKRKEQNDG